MGCLPRSACLGSLSLTQSPEFIGPWGMFGDQGQPSLFEDQSFHVSGPNRLCAAAQSGDDTPFHKQACTEYTKLVFCKLFGRPKERHLACPTKMHGSLLLSFQGYVLIYGLTLPSDHLCGGDMGPGRLCAQAQSGDDMPFHKQACTEYTRWVFCKLFGRPKERHLACPTRMHGSRPLSLKCGKLSKGYNKPEWSRFVTIVKQQHKLDEVSYHKLFDILKQYQKEVNELRAERLARNANPLALVATAQANQDPYYQTSKSYESYAPSSKPSIPTRTYTTTRYKGKEIAKPITPPSETTSKEDNDPEQAQRDKDMQKNLALIAKYFKNIYKPINNNLRTSSNLRNKNVDTNPRYKNDNQSGQFRNQRMVNVAGARENVGSPVVQQSGIQCFNCKEFGHFAKECRKPKRVKDSAYHKEKM
nr:hypothetical protein [Tanacetum cinerariifolium]